MTDSLVIGALSAAATRQPETAAHFEWSADSWRDADQITHLDALSPERHRLLASVGARRIAPRVIPFLLSHLTDVNLPYTIAVPGGGCVQLHRGASALVEYAGNHVAAVFGAARYALDPLAIAECWVTQAHSPVGVTSAVELYDHQDRCVTLITQTGAICAHLHEAWEAIVESLPDVD